MNIDHSAINMQNIAISKLEDPTSPSVFSTSIRITISTVEMEVDLAQFFATQNISYNSAKNDVTTPETSRTLTEAGAKAVAAPIRERQIAAVFMVGDKTARVLV